MGRFPQVEGSYIQKRRDPAADDQSWARVIFSLVALAVSPHLVAARIIGIIFLERGTRVAIRVTASLMRKQNNRRVTPCREFVKNGLLSGDATEICRLSLRLFVIVFGCCCRGRHRC